MRTEKPKAEICLRCGERHMCKGICKEMNEYLVKKRGGGSNGIRRFL